MNIPTLQDYPRISASGENISNESHIIPSASPYVVPLNQWPVITTDTITSQADNVWDDLATAQSLITVTVDSSARTIVDTTPSSGQVQLQLANQQYRYSPYLTFHSSDAGETAQISYTGLGSVNLAHYVSTLFAQIQRLESFPYLRIVSLGTYNGGNYDGNGANGKGFYVNPAGFALEFDGVAYTWSGGSYDLSSLTAFTTATYWKRLGVYLTISGGVPVITITQSAEASTQGGLSNPSAPSVTHLYLGSIDVQDDGSTTTGSINVVAESAITPELVMVSATTPQLSGTFTDDGNIAGVFPGAGTYQVTVSIVNTTANAVTGGVNLGSSSGGTDIASALAVGANANVITSATVVTAAAAALYIEDVTAWNSASVTVYVTVRQVA